MEVKWDNGYSSTYRMGAENCYDIQLAGKNVYVCVYTKLNLL